MIAKASSIAHGGNAIRYSVNKDRADIVKVNLLPDDISPEAISARMSLTQKKYADQIRKGRPLNNRVIRFELSPTKEETAGWTMDEWAKLADEFIRVFDSLDLSKYTKRNNSKRTNIQGSQYVVALHRDSKSGILHLHIDANRVDNDGNVNDDHMIGMRAVTAANIINDRRGWVQSEEISQQNKKKISGDCMSILRKMKSFSWSEYEAMLSREGYQLKLLCNSTGIVKGYSIKSGNSIYKSSELGIGRNLTPSKIYTTWGKLHPQQNQSEQVKPVTPSVTIADSKPKPMDTKPAMLVMKHYNIATDDYHSYPVTISEEAEAIIRQECSLEGAHPWATIEEIRNTALLLFAEYLDAATSMAESSGGGGNTSDMKWGRDPDEDDKVWARRCAKIANSMCKKRSNGLHR